MKKSLSVRLTEINKSVCWHETVLQPESLSLQVRTMACFFATRGNVFFLVYKNVLQLYCNEFVIQRLAPAHYDSVCIRKSIMHLLACWQICFLSGL